VTPFYATGLSLLWHHHHRRSTKNQIHIRSHIETRACGTRTRKSVGLVFSKGFGLELSGISSTAG